MIKAILVLSMFFREKNIVHDIQYLHTIFLLNGKYFAECFQPLKRA